ncbi:MAG: hypothetical protein U0800_00430 [Isosphaeraceae bacterium]
MVRRNGRGVLQGGLGRAPLSGVGSLSADQPMLLAFNRLPFGPRRAPFDHRHRRIPPGASARIDRRRDRPLPGAHLDGVPEAFVIAEHRQLPRNPGVIAEVRRILELHAAGYNGGP